MNPPSGLIEFDRYRFARDERGAFAEIRANQVGERIFYVVDCDYFRMVRLHVLEGARNGTCSASPSGFRAEMESIQSLCHPQLNPVLAYGEDDTELFYTEAIPDGEALRDYLRRSGPLPGPHAIRLTLELIGILQCQRTIPRTLENFSLHGLFLEPDRTEGARLIFSDYSGWNQESPRSESQLVDRVMGFLVSLLAGEIVETVSPDLLLPDAPESLRPLIDTASGDGYDPRLGRLESFREALLKIQEAGEDYFQEIPLPRREFRTWLEKGDESLQIGPEFRRLDAAELNGSADSPALAYAIDASSEKANGTRNIRFQLFPGEKTIPLYGWLEQHRAALRRKGRGFPNQIRVTTTLPCERALLIGEERVEGISLRTIVEKAGTLELPHLLSLARKLNAALDSIEKSAGASPIWWLPPENILVVTGDQNLASLHDALDRLGTETWQRLPVRLRLHQTAESLLEGIDLPPSLRERMRSGLRINNSARRLAVIIPFLWYGLTGRRFRWQEELVYPEDQATLSPEPGKLLERIRKQLLDDPRHAHFNVIEMLTRADDPETRFNTDVLAAERDSRTVSISDLAPVAGSRATDTEPASSGGDSFARADSLKMDAAEQDGGEARVDSVSPPLSEPVTTEIESLGLIDDTAWGHERSDFRTGKEEAHEEEIGWAAVESRVAATISESAETTKETREGFGPDHFSNLFPVPSPGKLGFGERMLDSKSATLSNRQLKRSPLRIWLRVTCLFLLVIGLLWGIARAFSAVSSWASRQALAEETFLLTHYPGMKTGRDLPMPSGASQAAAGRSAFDRQQLTQSAEAGDPASQRELGLLLAGIPGEMGEAAAWFRKAADRGDTDAQFHFGECLVFGRGVARNVRLAVDKYLANAAEAGDGRAMELLGVCYAEGRAVTADPVRARKLFEQAVAAGNPDAYYDLAVRYAKGHGAERSEPESARLFRDGAERGDPACMYAFGRCLETGFGVPKDFDRAREWLKKAASLGFDDARAWCGLNGIVLAGTDGAE